MHKLSFILISLFTCKISNSQNVVPNGDFEQYTSCPISSGSIDSVINWMNPTFSILYGGSGGTPDYFNYCANGFSVFGVPDNYQSFQPARSANGYAGMVLFGIFTDYREYIEASFSSSQGTSLLANQCYHLEMYINLSNKSKITSYNLGAYFSDTLIQGINNYFPLSFTPQINNISGNYPDTLNWTLVSGDYTAIGGESYLIIGNFDNDASTTTAIVNPASTINTVYIFIDDISLTPCVPLETSNQDNNIEINLFPNPLSNTLNIKVNNNDITEISLYDLTSRKLLKETFRSSAQINTEQLANGIYIYEITNTKGTIKKGKVIKK